MRNKYKNVLIYGGIALIIVIAVLVFIFNKTPVTPITEPGRFDALAKCLTSTGVVIYGTTWCPHCNNQKALFGSSFQYINFVDCDKNNQECVDAGVEGYPTWKINGTNYPGEQGMYTIAKNAGCADFLR